MSRIEHRPKSSARTTRQAQTTHFEPDGIGRSGGKGVDAEAVERILSVATDFEAEPTSETDQNLMRELASVSMETAVEALHRIAHEMGEKAVPVLRSLAQKQNQDIAQFAIEALGATRSEDAASILASVAAGQQGQSKVIQKAARRALFHLKTAGIVPSAAIQPHEEPIAEVRATADLTLWKAFMTNADGEGTQLFQAGAEGPMGRLEAFDVLMNDVVGLKDFVASDTTGRAWLKRISSEAEAMHGIRKVEIPLAHFQHRVKQAYELTTAQGHTAPRGFERWKALLAEPPEPLERHPVYDDISLVEIKWDPSLLESSPEILRHADLASWYLPEKELKSSIEELTALSKSKVALPSWVEDEREHDIFAKASEKCFDPTSSARYKVRLEDAAYVFFHTERPIEAKRALAAAVAFDAATGVPPAKNPFAQALIMKTLRMILGSAEGTEGSEAGPGLITDTTELAPFIRRESD